MSSTTTTQNSFLRDFLIYVGRIREFRPVDWTVYICWIGMMLGLLVMVAGFVAIGHFNDVPFPAYVYNVPLGVLIFSAAIGMDTIGHRTIYFQVLQKGESLVHHITIFAGVTSVLLLCLAYHFPVFLRIPALTFVALSILYSIIDEAMHWHRYMTLNSDRVEMWAHFFIFVGHTIMILSWWHWFDQGYPGVAETLAVIYS